MGIIDKEWMDKYHEYLIQALENKQPILVSGTNIKTVNGQSILGEGNINFMQIVAADALPAASTSTLNQIYLIPSSNPDEAAKNVKEEWVTVVKKVVVYNNTNYPVVLKGNAVGYYMYPAPPGEHDGDILLHTNEDIKTLSWNDGHSDDDGIQIWDATYQEWSGESVTLGDAYKYSGDTLVCTPTGWENIDNLSYIIYDWELVGSTAIDLNNYYTKTQADNAFQAKLVSGSNIKTINNASILGSGNLTIKECPIKIARTDFTVSDLLASSISGPTIDYINDLRQGIANIDLLLIPNNFGNAKTCVVANVKEAGSTFTFEFIFGSSLYTVTGNSGDTYTVTQTQFSQSMMV